MIVSSFLHRSQSPLDTRYTDIQSHLHLLIWIRRDRTMEYGILIRISADTLLFQANREDCESPCVSEHILMGSLRKKHTHPGHRAATNIHLPTPKLLAISTHLLCSCSSLRLCTHFSKTKVSLPCAHSCFFGQTPHYLDLLDVGTVTFLLCNKAHSSQARGQQHVGVSTHLGRLSSSLSYLTFFWRC